MRSSTSPYFKALNRHFTFFGVDTRLFFCIAGISLPIVFSSGFHPMMLLLAALIFIVLHSLGVLMTRADTQILPVIRTYIHYQSYYPACSTIYAKPAFVKPSVPFYQGKKGWV